ncbi:MAG: oligosaccharide flippase family protein [Gallionella sp.]|jgi:O-antigen/teichoic acid export membrane protein|nr:oligosaccharide flippase family protein [Gallionella sp.]
MKTLVNAILSKAGGALFTLALVAYLGHAIGPEASGYFYFTLAVAVMLSQLLRLGMDGVVLRLSSRYHQAGDADALRKLAGDVLVYLIGCGALMVAAGLALEGYAAPLVFPGESPHLLYKTALYSFLPFTLVWTGAALLKGIGKTSLSVFIEAGSVPLIVLLWMQLYTDGGGYGEAVSGLLWANVFAALWTLALVFRHAGCSIALTGLYARCRELLTESVRGVWVAISNTLIVWSPLFFLGMLATPVDVGVYNAAFRVTMVIGAFSAVFRGIATPLLAGLLQRKESPVPFLKRSMAHIMAAGLLVLVAGELTFDWLFAHFGAGFTAASALAMLMLVGMLANVLFVIMETQLILADRNDLLRANALFTLFVGLPLTLVLILYFQAYGAALGFVLTNVLSRSNMLYLFNRSYACRI